MEALDQDRVRRFYDRFGRKQDKQGFYEGAALERLADLGGFKAAGSVLEVGCGTGKFAAHLLTDRLPATACYVGIDISPTMVSFASERLAPWRDRVRICRSDGGFDFSSYGSEFDRVVFTYVFDLMGDDQIAQALSGARAALRGGGFLCSAGLTRGKGLFSRMTCGIWNAIHRLNPYLVGGCRPLVLVDRLAGSDWRIVHRETVVQATIPSEVLIAEKI